MTSSKEESSDNGVAVDEDTKGDSFQIAERDGSNMENNLTHQVPCYDSGHSNGCISISNLLHSANFFIVLSIVDAYCKCFLCCANSTCGQASC